MAMGRVGRTEYMPGTQPGEAGFLWQEHTDRKGHCVFKDWGMKVRMRAMVTASLCSQLLPAPSSIRQRKQGEQVHLGNN